MRSFRTYADDTGSIDIGAVCHAILVIPDVPDGARLDDVNSTTGAVSAPGTYPLEVVTDGGGEALRLMGPSALYFASARLVRQLTGAAARSCWRLVLLDAEERYTHAPGLRVATRIAIAHGALQYMPSTPQDVIDFSMWTGPTFDKAGFIVSPYTESLRLTLSVQGSTTNTQVVLWVRPVGAKADEYNYGFVKWDAFSLTETTTKTYDNLPHGARVVIAGGDPPTGDVIYPRVDATLRLP